MDFVGARRSFNKSTTLFEKLQRTLLTLRLGRSPSAPPLYISKIALYWNNKYILSTLQYNYISLITNYLIIDSGQTAIVTFILFFGGAYFLILLVDLLDMRSSGGGTSTFDVIVNLAKVPSIDSVVRILIPFAT